MLKIFGGWGSGENAIPCHDRETGLRAADEKMGISAMPSKPTMAPDKVQPEGHAFDTGPLSPVRSPQSLQSASPDASGPVDIAIWTDMSLA